MREVFARVCELQMTWSNANTPGMQERGDLVRNTIPGWLETFLPDLAHDMRREVGDAAVQGRDGTGRKTETPWVRFYSKSHAPTPRDGWYCVYLFHARGDGFYLALGHGSTTWVNGEFKPRDDVELARLTGWARSVLPEGITATPALTSAIDLGAQHSYLGESYAKATAMAKWYPAMQIPSTADLRADARTFARLLGCLYDHVELGRSEAEHAPEVRAAQSNVEAIARPQSPLARSGGQGIGLNAAERKAVEIQAMKVAAEHLERLGWQLVDVSATKPYDYEARRNDEMLIVEVKGSTGPAEQILLTAPEAKAHQAAHPANGLAVVSMIDLERHPTRPRASGGRITFLSPWNLDQSRLVPIAFRYEL